MESKLKLEDYFEDLQNQGELGASYPSQGNDLNFSLEESSFWFNHRWSCLSEAFKNFPPTPPFFDFGGGTGFIASRINTQLCKTVLIESDPKGLAVARGRKIENIISADLSQIALKKNSIPSAGLFDVLEHIDDDGNFLRKLNEGMTPGGKLYLTVPALPLLWSSEDKWAGHFRRYTSQTLKDTLNETRFKITYMTPIFSFLVLPILLGRALPSRMGLRKKGGTKAYKREHTSTSLIKPFTAYETSAISKRKVLATGSSLLAVAERL